MPSRQPLRPLSPSRTSVRLQPPVELPAYLPARMVNEFVYCPRLFFYEWVEGVFRHSAEQPLYRIEKDPKLARRQGAYAVVATSGLILKRGHDLARVLTVFDARMRLVKA